MKSNIRFGFSANTSNWGPQYIFVFFLLIQKWNFIFQVLDGGDLDITFELFDPSGKRLVRDVRQEDGMHTVDTKGNAGAYQLCFDNKFSMLTDKVTICFSNC